MVPVALQFGMRGNPPIESPAEMLADGHVTCSISCLNGHCRHEAMVRLDTLPQDQHWPRIGVGFAAPHAAQKAAVNIIPNWYDRIGHATPFTREWKT